MIEQVDLHSRYDRLIELYESSKNQGWHTESLETPENWKDFVRRKLQTECIQTPMFLKSSTESY